MVNLIPKTTDRIICVKIGKIVRKDIYEMTRKYWKINIKKASKSTHVLAIMNSTVIAVYKPQQWKYTDNSDYSGRCEFIGIQDLQSSYIGANVSQLYGKSSNPVKYVNY